MLGDSPLVSYYKQAKYFSATNGAITRVVIHDMEYPETPQGAEWCCDFFAGSGAPKASAHYEVDNNSVAQSVRESQRAWHAPPNNGSIGIEHAGYSAQARKDWLDAYSLAELKISAKLTADICKRHNLPIVKLSVADLKAGKEGICGHLDVSNAWHQTDHGDPGPNFPWDLYIQWVKEAGQPAPPPEPEDDMKPLVVRVKGTQTGYLVAGDKLLAIDSREHLTQLTGDPKYPVIELPSNHFIWKLPKV